MTDRKLVNVAEQKRRLSEEAPVPSAEQQSLEELKQSVGGDPNELLEYVNDVSMLQDEKAELEKQLKLVEKDLNIAKDILLSKMLELNIKKFETDTHKVKQTDFIAPFVLKEDRDEQMEWLREVGGEALITETVNYQKFGAFVRNDFIPSLPLVDDKMSGKKVPDLSKLPKIIQLKPLRKVDCKKI